MASLDPGPPLHLFPWGAAGGPSHPPRTAPRDPCSEEEEEEEEEACTGVPTTTPPHLAPLPSTTGTTITTTTTPLTPTTAA